jgi:hypothetical protein
VSRVRSTSAVFVAAGLLLAPWACAERETGPTTDSGRAGNLVPNGSFEQDGQATLDTWQVANPSLATLTPQPAPGGGRWSLRLAASGAPSTGQVRCAIAGLQDGDTVRLSAYVQASGEKGGGLVGLEITSPDGRIRWQSFASTDLAQWTQLSVEEQLSLEPGDTVWVVLKSPPTQLSSRAGVFDLVRLERVPRPS